MINHESQPARHETDEYFSKQFAEYYPGIFGNYSPPNSINDFLNHATYWSLPGPRFLANIVVYDQSNIPARISQRPSDFYFRYNVSAEKSPLPVSVDYNYDGQDGGFFYIQYEDEDHCSVSLKLGINRQFKYYQLESYRISPPSLASQIEIEEGLVSFTILNRALEKKHPFRELVLPYTVFVVNPDCIKNRPVLLRQYYDYIDRGGNGRYRGWL